MVLAKLGRYFVCVSLQVVRAIVVVDKMNILSTNGVKQEEDLCILQLKMLNFLITFCITTKCVSECMNEMLTIYETFQIQLI